MVTTWEALINVASEYFEKNDSIPVSQIKGVLKCSANKSKKLRNSEWWEENVYLDTVTNVYRKKNPSSQPALIKSGVIIVNPANNKEITCTYCNQKGHLAQNCPNNSYIKSKYNDLLDGITKILQFRFQRQNSSRPYWKFQSTLWKTRI